MGLAFLPWERLPAYVFGPLLCLVNVGLFVAEDHPPFSHWGWEVGGFAIGVWVVWYRVRTGKEPFAAEKAERSPGSKP